MVVSQSDTGGHGSISIELIRARFAGAAVQEAALHWDLVCGGDVHQTRGFAAVENRQAIADAHDWPAANFGAAARRARFQGKNGEALGKCPCPRQLNCAPEPDLLRASKDAQAMNLCFGGFQFSKKTDDFRATEQVITRARVDLPIPDLKCRQIPHGEIAELLPPRIDQKALGHRTEKTPAAV